MLWQWMPVDLKWHCTFGLPRKSLCFSWSTSCFRGRNTTASGTRSGATISLRWWETKKIEFALHTTYSYSLMIMTGQTNVEFGSFRFDLWESLTWNGYTNWANVVLCLENSPKRSPKHLLWLLFDFLPSPGQQRPAPPLPCPSGPSGNRQLLHCVTPGSKSQSHRRHINMNAWSV